MQMTISSVTFFVGLALVVLAIFGGGIEIKEVKIPTLPIVPRTMSFFAGCALIILCIWYPQVFPLSSGTSIADKRESAADKAKEPPFLGAAIKNHLISVRDVKVILRRLGKYAGAIDDEANAAYFQAVAEFQASQGVEPDGYVGPVTYSKLRTAWPEYFASK